MKFQFNDQYRRFLFAGLGTALAIFVGCASSVPSSSKERSPRVLSLQSPVFEHEHKKILAEIANSREPASAEQDLIAEVLGKNLQPLVYNKTSSFSVMLFPKHKSMASKNLTTEESFGSPIEFTGRVILSDLCRSIVQKRSFTKISAPEIFYKVGADPKLSGLRCAVIRIFDAELIGSPQLQTENDLLEVRIYLDERGVVHGSQTDRVERRRQPRVTTLLEDQNDGSFSGLDLMPMDLPPMFRDVSLSWKFSRKIVNDTAMPVRSRLPSEFQDNPGLIRLAQKKARKFVVSNCPASLLEYQDRLGSKVKMSWCAGDPWPTFTETERFVAFLVKEK